MDKIFRANLEFVREDDYVEYFIFPKLKNTLSNDENEHEQLIRQELEEVRGHCMKLVEQLIKERQYIWHKDEFQLRIRTCTKQEILLNDDESTSTSTKEKATSKNAQEDTLPPHLHGVTHYGDNIADEWFIVFLLKQLTKEFPNITARVIDSDGEFLLIEAADVLPKWANPDTCEQRVYLANGCMHLVQNSPSNTVKIMSVATAVSKIQDNQTLYKVSKEIQSCIDERMKEFETLENTNLHHQIVRLPLGVAMILKKQPSLIAAAVRAFCERDPIDMKACRSMRYFPPEQRVRTNVCFTKCLYAMIMHSNYMPDRKIGWNLTGSPSSEEYKEDLLGIKLACGFEILASQAKDAKDEENSPTWKAYVRSLQAKGYFRENIEGSADYKKLLEQAKLYFKDNQTRFRTAPLVGKEILDLLRSTEINAEELRDEENNLRPSDSDDWLNITAEQLDAMLTERYGPKKLYKSNGDINAEEFTKNIAEFLEKQSAFEGIERDSDDDSTDEETASARRFNNRADFKAKVKKNNSMRQACRKNPVQLNQSINTSDADESFTTQVKSFLDFVIPEDKWDSNSEMSDYEDEDDMERNFAAMADAEKHIDADIKAYMDQMDRELAKTTIGQSFSAASTKKTKTTASKATAEDDFDDIEDFEPININVNTLKNMMDSYKSQIGGAGPVSNLLNAMGVGMSAAAACDSTEDLKESAV
ncbi:SGT1-like protein ecdysoneless [Lucilia cuprina]|uniref:SGT1-like protein ecdysoneless n=1 Tax=Lucilia cuprina TaxID=7375 RepID=A0A0L0CH30_LUCCU|nr:SGT1-like protein ecdysoneless [Lucilia cuprina]